MVDDTPLSKQCLFIEGLASDEIKRQIRSSVDIIPLENERVGFVTFAYADIPVGFQYDVVFLYKDPNQFVNSKCVIKSVTQQYLKPFPHIPEGWKTIILLSFPDGVPDIIDHLPVVGNWYESRSYVCLSSKETWTAIIAEQNSGTDLI